MNARERSETSRRGSALRFPLAALAFAAAITLLLFAGCGLNTQGEGNGGSGGSGGSVSCNVASQCDDKNPCTTDACGPDKTCVFTPLNGVNSPVQTAGDCKTAVCVKGKVVEKTNDNNAPPNPTTCSNNSCDMGVAVHALQPQGTVCDNMGMAGTCDEHGNCAVACTTAAMCVTMNPCVTPSCDASMGVCVFTNLPDGMPTPGVKPIAGDCKVSICVGGMNIMENDDSDVPVTTNDCETAVCTDGVPSNPPVPFDKPCSTFMGDKGGFCDHASPNAACQACVSDGDCQGPINDCKHPACDVATFTCTVANTPSGMPAAGTSNPPQVAGDCQLLVCDGNGGTMNIYDSMDPANDGNACTTDTCTAPSMTSHTPVNDGTHCGMGGTLACVGGLCSGCTTNGMCNPASCAGTVLTKSQTCNGSGVCAGTPTQDCAPYLCSAANDDCTSSCNVDGDCSQGGVGNYCTGAGGTCAAKLAQGAACGVAADGHECQSGFCVDGVCCNNACAGTCFACSAAKTGGMNGTCGAVTSGTNPDGDCNNMGAASCMETGFCNNGACALYVSGTPCVASSCMGGTLTNVRTCNGSGTCTTPVPPTVACAPYLCTSGACTTMCAVDTDCAAGDYCSGGACVAKLSNGSACGATDQCTSGFCVDGFCCNVACTAACQACSAAKKQSGVNGTCGNATNEAADPRGLCVMSTQSSCLTDGLCNTGVCEKWASGTPCAAATCSGSTVTAAKQCDGLGTAGSCNQGGGSMACANGLKCNAGMTACLAGCGAVSPAGDSNCSAGYCDGVGAGVCHPKIATGATACTVDTECVSAHCGTANGVCCTASCPDQGAATCGTSAACNPGTGACLDYDGTTPCSAATCAGSTLTTYTLCDGAGTCDSGASTMGCPGNFACNGNGCYAACGAVGAGGDAKCAAGYYCDGVSGGACQPRIAVGTAGCTAADQCAAPGICGSNGTCCAAACNGSATCNTGCAAVTGACVYSPPMTECVPGTCGANNKTLNGLSVCDGSGGCQTTAGLPDCPMNQCSAGGCTQCGADNQCTAYGYCANPGPTGTCTARVLSGGACTMDNQCLSTHCNQNMNTTCQ